MLRFIAISSTALTALALASCSAPTAPPEVATPAPSVAAAKPATAKVTFDAKTIAGLKTLQTVVSKTATAVTAGDFATASTEFEGFEKTWKSIEDAISPKSTETYTSVEKSAKAIEAGLKSKEKAGTLSALTALNTILANSVK
jgi:hypothetical protein